MGANESTEGGQTKESSSYRLNFAHCYHSDGILVTEEYIDNWGGTDQDIIADVTFKSPGRCNISVGISNSLNHAAASIEIEASGMLHRLDIKPEDNYDRVTKIPIGALEVKKPGFQTIRIRAQEDEEGAVGRLHYVELSGPAIYKFNQHKITETQFQKASSVHLMWKTSTRGVNMFYNEVIVPDCQAARFVACGFSRGYLGLVKGKVVFGVGSPWLVPGQDPFPMTSRKPSIIKHGYGGKVAHLNSGLDIECSFIYKWRVGEVCRFLLSAKISDLKRSVFYSAYFYNNDTERWAFMATIKIYSFMNSFSELRSSIEECQYFHGDNLYTATVGPAWKHVKGKGWKQLAQAKFDPDKVQSMPYEINAGVNESGSFYLSTGGSTKPEVVPSTLLHTRTSAELPEVLANLDIDNQEDDRDAWHGISKYLIKGAP